jgi:hypothetical protein
MAYYSTIIAPDGLPLTLCIPGPGIPSSLDAVEYVNPRTGNTERFTGGGAWAGSPDIPCDPKRGTPGKIIRRP